MSAAPPSSPVDRMIVVRDEAFRHVERFYIANLGLPMPMSALARAFGKRARATGHSLTEVLLDDPRLFMQMTRKGGYLVVPRALYIEAYVEEGSEIQEKFWRAHDVLEPVTLNLREAAARAKAAKEAARLEPSNS